MAETYRAVAGRSSHDRDARHHFPVMVRAHTVKRITRLPWTATARNAAVPSAPILLVL